MELLEQYKLIVEKLEAVERDHHKIKEYDEIKEKLRKTERELKEKSSEFMLMKSQNELLTRILQWQHWIKICHQCGWDWYLTERDWYSWTCEACEWKWIISDKQ